ncbi:MAG: hypothetical protein WCK57_13725 [Verrucomicrobiae bacterium]|jgi:hypothetical protein
MENNKEEPIKVFLVNPPSENPWRTRQDYLDNQRRERIQFRVTIASLVISILSVFATAIVAIESLKRMTEFQASMVNGIDSKLYAKAEGQLKKHIENLKSEGRNSPIKWGAIRNLHYKISPSDYGDTVSAVLVYEQNYSVDSHIAPFTSYDRCELNLHYSDNEWHLTGGTHRFFAPTGEQNPFPNWTPVTEDMSGIKMELDMDFFQKSK